jgi:hypothetical protein
MRDEGKRMYVAHLTERATLGEGMGVFTTWGVLTPCGEWVEQNFVYADPTRNNVIRHKVDHHWGETQAVAMAAKADKIRAIAQRMLEQADELEAAVKATEAVAS